MKKIDLWEVYNSSKPHIFKLSTGQIYEGTIENFQPNSPSVSLGLTKYRHKQDSIVTINIDDIEEVFEA